MKARLSGEIKSLVRKAVDSPWVDVLVDITGSVTDGMKEGSPEAKAMGAEVSLRMKPIMAETLKFGQKLYVEMSTDPLPGTAECQYCYHCGNSLRRMGPRDCPVCR